MKKYSGERDSSPDCEEDFEVYRIMVKHLKRTKPKARRAFNFIFKVKRRFSRKPDKVKRFLDIMEEHRRAQRLSPAKRPTPYDLFAKIKDLFDGKHPDLLEDFMDFMPRTSGTSRTSGSSRTSSTGGTSRSSGTGATSRTSGIGDSSSSSSISVVSGTSDNTPSPSKNRRVKQK